jgi:hypothetical protein
VAGERREEDQLLRRVTSVNKPIKPTEKLSPSPLSGVTLLCDLFKGHDNGKFFFWSFFL